MDRVDALKQAEETIERLSPSTKANGYPNDAVKLHDRVEAILRLANFLSTEVEETE